ncbi:hypothetical protein OROGR_025223 [Orobanche gracilis]
MEKEKKEEEKLMEHPMVVLVRTESTKHEEREVEFHLVDLKRKLIKLNYFPSVTNCVGPGAVLILGRNFLLFGGIFVDNSTIPLEKEKEKNGHNNFLHKGASIFGWSFNSWRPIGIPSNRVIPNPVGVCDKYFCFGGPTLCPETYFPSSSFWLEVPLPSHLQGRFLSFPVLPDPANSRILVHLCDQHQLYAFYPSEHRVKPYGHWSLLASDFHTWSPVVAIANDIIFFHHSDTCDIVSSAYHLPTRTYWVPRKVNQDASVHFLRFQVQIASASELKLTALDYQIYPIPSTYMVDDILLLPGVVQLLAWGCSWFGSYQQDWCTIRKNMCMQSRVDRHWAIPYSTLSSDGVTH